jgi:hypothetical protein
MKNKEITEKLNKCFEVGLFKSRGISNLLCISLPTLAKRREDGKWTELQIQKLKEIL